MAKPDSPNSKMTFDDVKKVSRLARLKLTDGELEAIRIQLAAVLENFEQISHVATEGIRPLITPTDIVPAMRKDEVIPFASDPLLANAPELSGRLFKVPPWI